MDKENQAKTALLEANLKSYKNNLIKESVRVGCPLFLPPCHVKVIQGCEAEKLIGIDGE